MNFKKWAKSIQTAGYNGARTVNNVIVRPIKIMNNLLKEFKTRTFKVIFQHQKSTESFLFFSVKIIKLGDQLLLLKFLIFRSTLFSKNVSNFCQLCS